MRTIIVGLASLVSVVLAPSLLAQQPTPAGFQQIVEITVKPGHSVEFERWMRDLVAAANKVNAPQTWTTFQSDLGRDAAIYRIALSFSTWGERDGWLPVRDMLVKANGEAQAEKMLASTADWNGGISNQIWENLPAGSANPQTQPANFYTVTIREVKPGRAADYIQLTEKWKAAYEASPSKLSVGRSVLRVGSSPGTTFRRAEAFDKWSDLDRRDAMQILNEQIGEQESARMAQMLNDMLVRQQTFVSVRRPELSREASSAAPGR